MKNPFRTIWPKRRKYPFVYDQEGRSIRVVCFQEFDRGKRPVQLSGEYGFNLNSVYTYHRDWKKLPQNWHRWRRIIQQARKEDPNVFSDLAYKAGKQLGMSRQEVLAHLQQPYGLLNLILGKWPLQDTTPATNEAITILRDLIRIIFWGGFNRDHPRNIIRHLEEDGIDFTLKRKRLWAGVSSDDSQPYENDDPLDNSDSDDAQNNYS